MIYVAFDPSIKCTGYAAIQYPHSDPRSTLGAEIVEIGRIKPDGDDDLARCVSLRNQVVDVVRRLVGARHAVVIVELPFRAGKGRPRVTRSAVTLPAYGMAVSAVLIGAEDAKWDCPSVKVGCAVAGEWCRGLPAVGEDRKKTERVLYAARLFNIDPTSFGPPTTAGDVADALLLAYTFAYCGRGVIEKLEKEHAS
jgi:Holliday junction resolvasome RuvABC endonuclease subunit